MCVPRYQNRNSALIETQATKAVTTCSRVTRSSSGFIFRAAISTSGAAGSEMAVAWTTGGWTLSVSTGFTVA